MGKVRTNISFDKEYLNQLKNDPKACVELHRQQYHLALHPFHLNNLNTSLKEILNGKIAKYDKSFQGILLGYQNVTLLNSAGSINFDSCYIHTNIEADFYIFKPVVGQILNGIVNKKSKDHVSCLVHNTFNVSLPKPADCDDWIGHSVQIGQDIQFEITFTDLEGKLPYIRGKISSVLSEDSGFSTSEEPNDKCKQNTITKFNDSDSDVSLDRKEKKKKRKRESNESERQPKRHKKESNTSDCEIEINSNNKISEEVCGITEITVKRHKKHKHKKNKDSFEHSEQAEDDEINDMKSQSTIIKKSKKTLEHDVNSLSNIDIASSETSSRTHVKKKKKRSKD